VIRKYEGTRLGRQELDAELREDTPGALWSHAVIDAARQAAAPHLVRIVVAIDPAASSGENADETGISWLG
jgi:phage terminase large subunit-like protein